MRRAQGEERGVWSLTPGPSPPTTRRGVTELAARVPILVAGPEIGARGDRLTPGPSPQTSWRGGTEFAARIHFLQPGGSLHP